MKKLKQLYLLLWKNFTLQRRRPIGTLVQLGLPLFMSLIFLVLRIFLITAKSHDAVTTPPYGIIKPPQTMTSSFKIGYSTAGTNLSESFLKNLIRFINEKHHPNQSVIFQHFQSQDAMISYLTETANNNSFIGGIHFFTTPGKSNGHLKYAIRLSSNPTTSKTSINAFTSKGREWVTRFVFPKFQLPQPRNVNDSYGENPSYYKEGFLLIQYAVDRAFMNQFGQEDITVLMQKFPFPNYNEDAFIVIIQGFLPNFLVIAFIYSALCIVRNVVYEKEKRLKEAMKIMGVHNWLHWFAWFLHSFVIIFISVLLMTLMFTIKFNDHGKVINKTSATVFFVFLLLYTISGIMFCFFVSVFFSKASTAAAGGGIIWYISYIPYFFIVQSYENMSLSLKTLCCLIPNLGMSLGSMVIGKFEGTGIGVHWDNLYSGASVDDNFSLGTVFLMLILNSVIYGVLAWYIEAVFPGEYGAPLPWYFPLLRSYWCGSFKKVNVEESLPLLNSHTDTRSHEQFEKDPDDLNVGIDIENLRKVYHGVMGEKIAVNDISLRMYEGQITVLLGHNGAGKTSLMSVLTGFYPPSSGTAVVNGYDIKTSMDGVRSSLALCPQHDVLFDTLTVKEHLWFFGKLKGTSSEEIGMEVQEMQESVNLVDKSNSQTRYLSGGMKRKLSLGLALIGKSKVIMLDEPTSGMDPSARRFTWDLLQRYRSGRTILLTTHFMDEADVLGDRIAIMAGGKIQCCGSSLFLKNKYGVGYHIVMVKQPRCNVKRITELVMQYVPKAKLESNAGAELSYLLPRESSKSFATLFSQLEDKYVELGIASYGASMTTMEEVFMKVGIEYDETLNEQLRSSYGGNAAINASMEGYEENGDCNNLLGAIAGSSADTSLVSNTGLMLWFQRWWAMFMKRFLHSIRHKIAIISQLLMPLIFTLFALIASETIPKPQNSPPRELSTSMFGSNDVPYAIKSLSDSRHDLHLLANNYIDFGLPETKPLYINNVSNYEDGNATKYLLDKSRGKNLGHFNRHYLVAATFEQQRHKVNVTAFFNDQAYHAVAVSLNAVDNAILKNVTGNTSMHITAINHPLPRSLKDKSNDLNSNGVGLNVAFNLLFGMAFLASSFIIFIVQERSNGAKHVQFVSGVDPLSYWTSAWCWDLINFLFPCVCVVILFACFNVPAYTGAVRLGIVFLVLILYGFAIIPFMYLFSFLFKVASKAYIRLTLLNIVTGLVALLLVNILNTLDYKDTSDVLNWIFLFLPNYSLGQTFMNIFTNYKNLQLYDELVEACEKMFPGIPCAEFVKNKIATTDGLNFQYQTNYMSWDTPGVGRFLLVLPLEGLLFMSLVLLVDYGVFRMLMGLCSRRNRVADAFDDAHKDIEDDSDVVAEKRRVFEGDCAGDVLVIKDLTKTFKVPGRPVFAAVDHISLGVPLGECFGLLGVNGAGKTTTFKMLTGDEIPTLGTASVDSFDIGTALNQVRQRTGYCPQFDALIDLMTGREMLRMYAALRGVRRENIDALVNELMHSLLLTEHADKLTKTYSGGNKRKLSAAIALVGDPLVVFLDEPTTGMDPVARRLLWNALCRVRAQGRCLVITSHSMEECEALCTRLSIMVNGKFKCLGGPQHLKNKFVQGFALLVNTPEHAPMDTTSLKHYIHSVFPDSVLRDEHNGLLNYHLKGNDKSWSSLFATLESAHDMGNIGNYAITQTTLEQIFLNFARGQIGYES